jgi:pSer/pThr/pTyr-binding forkhead associated (FHA) protein
VITLTLLHPLQSVPVQSWTFDSESVVQIGRSTDNHVILYSAVVSRHHVELRLSASGWEVVSLGANGTYLDGKRITQVPVVDGMVIRLASSGPKIQIRIGSTQPDGKQKTVSKTSASIPTSQTSDDTFVHNRSIDVDEQTQIDLRLSAFYVNYLSKYSNILAHN